LTSGTLNEDDEKKWLQPDLTFDEITALMQTYPAKNMQGYAIKPDFLKKNPFDPTILEPKTKRKSVTLLIFYGSD